MNPILVVIAASGTGFLAYRLTRFLSRRFISMGITGLDLHKPNSPVRAEMGGLALLLSLSFGSTILVAFDGERSAFFLTGLGTIFLVGLIGLADDHFELRQRHKALLIAAAGIPLSISLIGRTSISFPMIGTIPFGLLYPILLVPFALTASANFSNMLAGFNGLEAGIATISIGTLTFLSGVRGAWDAVVLGLLLLFGYLGFLTLNWYPAKIFPGDAGTLMFGAGIATVGLMSRLEFAAIVLLIPAALDCSLKALSKKPFAQRKLFGNTKVDSEGRLEPPDYPALAHAFMRVAPTTEKTLVLWILLMEALFAVMAVALTLAF